MAYFMPKMADFSQKWPKIGRKWPKIGKNGGFLAKMTQKGKNFPARFARRKIQGGGLPNFRLQRRFFDLPPPLGHT